MDQFPSLFGERGSDHRVGVTEHVHGEAADEVEVLLAVCIPDTSPFATVQHDGLTPIVLEEVAVLFGDPVGHGYSPFAPLAAQR